MTDLSFLFDQLLGGVIGYITNDIAIRMMFRPHQAKYIFGMKVPFTPGIIPKERFRIADAVGVSISENLMNREVLEKNLLSEEMIRKISDGYEHFIARQKVNNETLRAFLRHFLTDSDISAIQHDSGKDLAAQLHERLSSSSLSSMLSHAVIAHVKHKMDHGLMGVLGADQIFSFITGPAEHLLEKQVNQIISNNSEEIITQLVEQESEHLLDTKMCELLKGHDEQLAQLRQVLLDGYKTIITIHLPKILSTIDISSIIRDRINEMDMEESERIILEVMSKELRAIVWLGALLGCIIGTVNSII